MNIDSMNYNRKVVFRAACAGMLLFGICMITLGSVASDLREKLNLDELAAGTLFSILPLGIIAGSLIFGPVADRYGYKLLLIISALCLFAGFEGLAFTVSGTLLKLFIFLIGLGGGAVNGATNALVSDISEKDKSARISLLGVFYGLGALGMPLIMGLLKSRMNFDMIVSAVGLLTLMTGIFFTVIKFPPPKQAHGVPLTKSLKLFKDKLLLIIALFLCFQSGFEGIINNWTTTYLTSKLSVAPSSALYALSSFVGGMVAMRLLIGSIFRPWSPGRLLTLSFILTILGLILLKTGGSFALAISGLVLVGAGLSGGFPIMLGYVGSLYAELSGTAFSLVFFIALMGNTLINFLMGLVAQNFGVDHLITFAMAVTVIMILLSVIIVQKTKNIG
jgi:FHS family glucose/mannose:H+ symporter-like MFS transporter